MKSKKLDKFGRYKMKGHFEVFRSKNQWYFRLKAANGEIIADSEGYKTKQGALKGVASVQLNASKALVEIINSKEVLKKKELIKKIKSQEKKYKDPKKEDEKSELEEKDEHKVLSPSGSINWLKIKNGPRWL